MIEFFYCNKRFEKFDGFYFDENIFNKMNIRKNLKQLFQKQHTLDLKIIWRNL